MTVIIVSQYAKSLAHLSWRPPKGFSVHLCHLDIGKSLTITIHLILVKSTTMWVPREVLVPARSTQKWWGMQRKRAVVFILFPNKGAFLNGTHNKIT